jgi:hypothetical protein
MDGSTSACTSLNLEKERSICPEEIGLNPLDKGKSSSRARFSPFSGNIDLVVDRSRTATQFLDLKGQCSKPF